jgi:two-component system OmpR family response regulator
MGEEMKILVVEDDPAVGRALQRGLVEEKHEVVLVTDGVAGLEALRAGADVCVLDLQLPKLDGMTVLEKARAAGIGTPVLVLTARDAVPDRVAGLRSGADDYLTKPFAFAELVARLDALTRRRVHRTKVGELDLDLAARRARVGERELALSEKQFALLAFFVQHAGEVVTRAAVLKHVFGYDFDPGTNIVDVHVAHLRSKIADAQPLRISTVRGVGYRFEDV